MSNGCNYKPKKHEYVCIVCGKTFFSTHKGKKFCSASCFGQKMKRPDRKCETCGKMFYPKRNTTKFCSNECAWKAKTNRIQCNCDNCGKELNLIPALMKKKHHFCDKKCKGEYTTKTKTGVLRNDGICEHSGYTFIYQSKKHYRGQHRLVMEQYLGRPLRSDEIVHHKDGNKRNNDISNLEIVTRAEHINIHRTELHKARGIAEWKGVKEK